MPFARWESFDACVLDMRDQGHDEESAVKICGAIKNRVEKGFIYKASDTQLEILSKGSSDLVVGGFATYEIADPQNDVVTIEGQKSWLKSLFSLPEDCRLASYEHTDLKIGYPLKKYVAPDGTEHFSHVNEKGTYLITRIRPDDGTETMSMIRSMVAKGELGMYSIAGKPKTGKTVQKSEGGVTLNYRNEIEAWGYALCRNGVNPKAKTQVIAKSEPTKKRKVQLRAYDFDYTAPAGEPAKPHKTKWTIIGENKQIAWQGDVPEEGAEIELPLGHYTFEAESEGKPKQSYSREIMEAGSPEPQLMQFMFLSNMPKPKVNYEEIYKPEKQVTEQASQKPSEQVHVADSNTVTPDEEIEVLPLGGEVHRHGWSVAGVPESHRAAAVAEALKRWEEKYGVKKTSSLQVTAELLLRKHGFVEPEKTA